MSHENGTTAPQADQLIASIIAEAEEAGISLMAACEAADVNYTTLWRWSKNPPETLRKVAALQAEVHRMAQPES